ncbi:MAG: hypothetical protein MJZ67_08620 [Bacteroidales bacterium]|nr:hypothetical protein [Bacteroidales bacterium]
MQFKDIENQYDLANRLTEIIDSGRVSHAQLFLGPTSCGSLAMAVAYAQYLNCSNRQHYAPGSALRADSCGECPNCKKYRSLSHADLHFVYPTLSGANSENCLNDFKQFMIDNREHITENEWYTHLGAENKQGQIREPDAAHIVRTLSLKSYEGGFKVLIMWLPERMNLACSNELLKTIEEPAENTLILMVCEERDRLLSTIISRVQQVVVPGDSVGLTKEKREQYAQMFVNWMRLLFKLNMKPLADWVDEMAKLGRENQKQFLQYSMGALRACFLKNVGGIDLPNELDFGDEKFNAAFPTIITVRNIELMCNAINEAAYHIERNAHNKITFMQLSFTMSKLIKNR